jgi:hypothetical protein
LSEKKREEFMSISRTISFRHREESVVGGSGSSSQIAQEAPTCFILQRVKSFLTLDNLGNIVPHDVDGVIDLRLNVSGLGVRTRASFGGRGVG